MVFKLQHKLARVMHSEPEAPTTQQFTLRYLLLMMALLAVCLAPLSQWGSRGLPATIWLGCTTYCVLRKRFSIAAWLSVAFALGWLLLPTMGDARPTARRAECMNHIKQITLAIGNYEAIHGHLPPPYTTDKDGNPLHSWRVLILPHLEEQELYDAIDLTKPWHHPDNLALQERMPSVYRCPSFASNAKGIAPTTAYVAIVGEHTAWPRSGTRIMDDITDGTSKTLALIESEQHRIHWMSTADPGIESIGPLNADGETLLSISSHNGGVVFSRCDASIGFLPSDTPLSDLLSLISIDSADAISQ